VLDELLFDCCHLYHISYYLVPDPVLPCMATHPPYMRISVTFIWWMCISVGEHYSQY
jgi:hypothetical protein